MNVRALIGRTVRVTGGSGLDSAREGKVVQVFAQARTSGSIIRVQGLSNAHTGVALVRATLGGEMFSMFVSRLEVLA